MTDIIPAPRVGVHDYDDPAYMNRLNAIMELEAIYKVLRGSTQMRRVDMDWVHWSERLQAVARELRWGGPVPEGEV